MPVRLFPVDVAVWTTETVSRFIGKGGLPLFLELSGFLRAIR
jgi:hypothetical protein